MSILSPSQVDTRTASDPRSVLESIFGYKEFRPGQEEIVNHLTGGGNALVLMPTGGGKSRDQLPALLRPGLGIVVSPLIALMQDQIAGLKEVGVRAEMLNSALSPASRIQNRTGDSFRQFEDSLYGPGEAYQERTLALLSRVPLSLIAIDEAHCVSQWGHDFRPEYSGLAILADRFPDVPRVALTATADDPTRREIVEKLRLENGRTFVSKL